MADPPANRTAQAPSPAFPPLRPSAIFAGRRLVVVGGTGFLGKVWVSLLLHRFPEVGHLFLMVRARGEQSPEARFWADIASSHTFDPLRDRYPGAEFERFLTDKVTPIGGDVTKKRCGLDDELIASLRTSRIAAVVNVAGVVDFNPPLDEALEVNAFGVNNLIALAKTLDDAVLLHTSTCYVAGYRSGVIEEVDPREVPFPRAEGAPRERLIAPPKEIPVERRLDRSHWDPQNEIDECLDLIEHTRHRCNDAFRQSLFLDEAKHHLKKRGEPCRGRALEEEIQIVKRKFVRKRLIDAGLERALFWGWPNIYTYTKSIGEQVLAASGVPFTIVRPAVVESSSEYPFPGWNEGINTSAPFIYMALKGQMQFPNDRAVNLDIIAVDMVCSGMLAALAELIEGTHKPVYQFGGTDTNPCSMSRFLELIGLYKRKKWQDGGDGGSAVVQAILARCEPVHLTKHQYQAHGPHAIAGVARSMASLLDAAGTGPMAGLFRPAAKQLRKAAHSEDKVGDVMDAFLPFVVECDWIFRCDNTRHALGRMPPEERGLFHWSPEQVDWREWMFDVHLPGVEKWSVPLITERLRREVKPLRHYDHLLDILDEMAERHEHATALSFVESDGPSRITFAAWRDASNRVALRLLAAGVKKGDRVMLAADNRPAWPIAYFGILRAGAVVVPVDPKLSVTQLKNVVLQCGAKVVVWGAEVREVVGDELCRVLGGKGSALHTLDIDVASEDGEPLGSPPQPQIDPDDLASIIYTSGTTGEPKGVMLSHQNFTSLLAALTPLFALTPSDGVLSVLPLHHTFEFSCGLLLPMSRGARISYIGEISAERLGEGFSKTRVSAMVGVPALWQMLERRVVSGAREGGPIRAKVFDWALEFTRLFGKKTGIDASKLFFGRVHQKMGGRIKYLISGGGALPRSTADTFAGLGLPLSEGYGLTEAAPVLTVAKGSTRSRGGQVGKAIPGVEIKIDKANDLGVGEVLARGPNVMRGYFGNEEATRSVIDEDGFLHTGDLGKFNRRGELILSGRSKDVIVSATGENVYPDDVEEMLSDIPYITELSVVAIKRGDAEAVGCIAVPTIGDGEDRVQAHKLAMGSLRDAVSKLPQIWRPTIIKLYDADLPKTATRKVKRAEVTVILERLISASVPPPRDDGGQVGALATVKHAVSAIAGRKASDITETMSLAGDLGFDSLMSMELSVALESISEHALDATALNRVDTVADLVALIETRGGVPALGTPIETVETEPVVLSPVVAKTAKALLGRAQMGFYGHVMKPKVLGRAFLPHNRNSIVVSNHVSHLDMGFVKYALGSYGDNVVGLAAADYFFSGRWQRSYFEQLTNLQAFERKANLRQALRKAADTVLSGHTVLIFPEGTRSKDGTVQEFKSTLGHLALTTHVDIVPVCLKGTFESWPKGRRIPTRREIQAHIGPPLEAADLKRLTEGLKMAAACRMVANLARAAVVALQRGEMLRLDAFETAAEALGERPPHPLVTLFRGLESKYVSGRIGKNLIYYFSLGAEAEAKWTARLSPEGCQIEPGKPTGASADCVLKTTAEIFTKMMMESYVPTPIEVMSGVVKSNDVSLLATFQGAFDLR